MALRRVSTVLLVAACYAPMPQPGSPCTTGACPRPLVCSLTTATCELPIDGGAQSCASCPANDLPEGAIDVTAGGTFTADLTTATDNNASATCGGVGGRDVFYVVTLAAPQVYYFDAFGSTFDSVIRVYAGTCPSIDYSSVVMACGDDACSTPQGQLALSLAAGTSCIVVDQQSAAESQGAMMLTVIPGGRDGVALASGMQTNTGDTCNSTNLSEPLATNCDGPGSGGKDNGYFFTNCPGQAQTLDASLCTGSTFDTVLYVKRIDGAQVGCNDDSCGNRSKITDVPIADSLLFWLTVDGFDFDECGMYQLATNLR